MWRLAITNSIGGRTVVTDVSFNTFEELSDYVQTLFMIQGDIPKNTTASMVHPIMGRIKLTTTEVEN